MFPAALEFYGVINHEFVFNDCQSSFTIENMPVWTGMKSSPGVDHTHDFIMAAPQTGPIIQILDDDFSSEVIDRYSHDSYAFITNPPGLSEWSISMAENKLVNLAHWIGSKKPNSVLEIGGAIHGLEKFFAIVTILQITHVSIQPFNTNQTIKE